MKSHEPHSRRTAKRFIAAYSVKEVKAYRASLGSAATREFRATLIFDSLEQVDYTPQEIKDQGGIWVLLAKWSERGFERKRGKIRLLVLSGKIFAHLVPR